MSRGKSEEPTRQATLDFEARHTRSASTGVVSGATLPPEGPPEAGPRQSAVLRLVDHHRARHLQVVRKLLAESGVFRVR